MYDMVLYGDACPCARVVYMYMWRIVVVDEHQDDDTVKAANLRHGYQFAGKAISRSMTW